MRVYKDQVKFPELSLPFLELTQTSCSGFVATAAWREKTCQPNSVQPHAWLSTKEFFVSAHAVAKLSRVGARRPFNQPTNNQPTDQPATPCYQLHYIWMLPMLVSHATHHSAKPRILTKKLLTEVWGVHAGNGEQLDPRRTYQPGSGRREICTCGPAVPLHTTPYLRNRYRAGWLLAEKEDQQTVRTSRFQTGSTPAPKPRS